MNRRATPRLQLSVQRAIGGAAALGVPKKPAFQRWARAALLADAEVTIRLVGEVEGRQLNRDYRGKDYATNVLSFVYDNAEAPAMPAGLPLAGDLVLCVPVVAAEAQAQKKPLEAHYAHLVVHAILHLQGFDHETDDDAVRMETREREVLAGLGYPDPYAAER